MTDPQNTNQVRPLREGYQGSDKRGYQPDVAEKGYQPKADIAATEVPHVGSNAVVPTASDSSGSTSNSGGTSTGNQD
jgi:hypothetical protein